MDLGVGFFQEHNPNFVIGAVGEEGVTERLAGEEVIDGDLDPLAAFANSQSVDAFFVPGFGDK